MISGGRDLGVWDLVTGKSVKSLSESGSGEIKTLTVTPDDRVILSSQAGCSVCVWNFVESDIKPEPSEENWGYPEPQRPLMVLRGHEDDLLCIALTPGGRKAVTTSFDCTLRVWDLVAGGCVHVLKGHTALVRKVVLTPDGQTAVSASEDQTLRLWDIGTGSCQRVYHAGRRVLSVSAIKPTGEFACVTAGSTVHKLMLHNVEQGPPLITAVRLFRFATLPTPSEEQEFGSSLLSESDLLPGDYDEEIAARCPWCGQRFVPPITVIDAIGSIIKTANLSPDESPCLKLPGEAWAEPRLLSKCLYCLQQLRYNPFIVDNRDVYDFPHREEPKRDSTDTIKWPILTRS